MSVQDHSAPPVTLSDDVNILLVDDESRNLDVLESILTSPAYHLVRAHTAEEALMALLEGTFAVMVLDIQMPGTNGIELAHLIKQRKRTQHIPIIFLTAYYQEDKDVLQGYEVGAVDYLTKPVDARILKSKIAVFVELFQKNRELTALNATLENEIAQRRKAEQALRQINLELETRVQERIASHTELARQKDAQTRLFDATLSSITDLAYTFDLEGNWIYANEPLLRIWGKSLKEITGKSSLELGYPPALAARLKQQVREVVETRQPVRGETYYTDAAGVEDYHEYIFCPVLAPDGTVAAVCGTTRLTTEQRRAAQVAQQLAAIVESSADAIISKDINGIITSWNHGAEQLFGYRADEVVGKSVTILIPKERWDEEPNILKRIRRGERVDHYETIRQRKDGSLIEVSLTVSPIQDASGKIVGASKIGRDITQQKRAERELERVHKEVVAASHAKDDFLAALSHELRTPLNPVLLLASEAAEDPELSPAIRAQFTTIRNNVELEARLIDDLLDLTRITNGKLSLNVDGLDVHAVLHEAIAIVRRELDEKKLSLTVELAHENAETNGDAVRLQQIFWNVLKNAVKFTPQGGKISVETRINPNEKKISVEIKDTGIGLTTQEIEHIFNAFSQGEHAINKNTHRFGGLGLGLTISRMLVELHAGVIYARSEGRGQGATFIIELPLSKAEKKAASPTISGADLKSNSATGKKASGKRILLVEDHEATRTALVYLLTRQQCKVSAAGSLAEARQLAKAESFDLVLSDIGLPDGDGYTLMAELREEFGLRGIALTGYGMEQDVARSQSAGFFAHLTKPIRMESLKKILHEEA